MLLFLFNIFVCTHDAVSYTLKAGLNTELLDFIGFKNQLAFVDRNKIVILFLFLIVILMNFHRNTKK